MPSAQLLRGSQRNGTPLPTAVSASSHAPYLSFLAFPQEPVAQLNHLRLGPCLRLCFQPRPQSGLFWPPHPCTRGDNALPSLLPRLFPQDTRAQLWSIVCWIQEPPHFPRGPNHSCLSNNSSCSAIISSFKPHKQKMPSAKKYPSQVDPGIGWGEHTLPASNQACDSVFTMGHITGKSPTRHFHALGLHGCVHVF